MNFEKLTDELSKLYDDIRNGKIEVSLAHELNNTALNIQGNVRLGLLNSKLRNEAPNLKFFKEERKQAVRETTRKASRSATKKGQSNG